ncbi:MFS transporter [Schleiferilactobacillus shenzhenensis]|uniref:Major facilitator superfamily (MFS) profile domain-containing protein n=1 Tax=Schleiferilactobacillus shenzhenensis LY-73 TaxID=1231336 RepID=U4TX87_9LACO|nr:MFS transporter [Schleiferilactobacillus shenzhenensis]ERL65962.1 hypothetical protein L248_2038 [Schleiferilactobacillus shenzhenensis LY-73]
MTTAPSAKKTSSPWLLAILSCGFIMAVLDTTGVVLAVPEIKKFLVVSMGSSIWIINAYILSLSTLLLLAGNLANKYGARRMLVTGMVLFILASLGCAFAGSITLLIALRFIQGIGAALFMPSSMVILYAAYAPSGQLPKMLGIWTAIISVATGTGSFIGGTLLQLFVWRSVFLINIPLGLLTITYILRQVPVDKKDATVKIDLLSNLLLVCTLASGVIFLVEGNQFGYGRWRILIFLGLTILFGGLFALRLVHSQAPIIPKVLLGKPEFTAMNLVGLLTNVSLYGIVLVLGLYYQMALHLSAMTAGLLILPGMTVLIFGNMVYAKFSDRIAPARLAAGAALVTLLGAGSMLLLAYLLAPLPLWAIILNFAVMSSGIGVVVPASTTLLMAAAGKTHASVAGAALNANKQIGGLFGTAIMGIVIANGGTNWAGIMQWTFLINVVLYLLAMVLIGRLAGRKVPAAAPTDDPD